MELESLTNELFLEIFDYVNDLDLLRIFYNLNFRSDRLLSISIRNFHLHFRSISKKDMDLICGHVFPIRMHKIVSLDLSDDDDTPYQSEQFFKYNFRFYEFVGLERLSLHNIRIPVVLYKIIIYLRSLPHFTRLKIDQIHFDIDEVPVFIEKIWSVSTLTYLSILDRDFPSCLFMSDIMISLSLKHVCFMENYFSIDQLMRLLKCTPYLEKLSI